MVNLDKREYISPHDFGTGAKLLEIGSGGYPILGLTIWERCFLADTWCFWLVDQYQYYENDICDWYMGVFVSPGICRPEDHMGFCPQIGWVPSPP